MSTESNAAGQIPWVRILAEATAIILSILLAFAIDAAWGARQLRETELEYLSALRVEMIGAADELSEDHGRRDRWLALSDSVLEQVSDRSVPDTVINIWVQEVTMLLTRFFPPSSVLTDMVSSGNLSLLTSNDLRFALLSYQQARERLNFVEDWAARVDEDGLRPYLTLHFRWTEDTPLPLTADGRLPPDPMRPVELPAGALERMLNDPVFQNLILSKRQRLGITQRRSGHLAELIDDVIGLIDRDLAGR